MLYASGSGGGGSTVNTYGCWINPNFIVVVFTDIMPYLVLTVVSQYGTCGCYILCNCTRNLCIKQVEVWCCLRHMIDTTLQDHVELRGAAVLLLLSLITPLTAVILQTV